MLLQVLLSPRRFFKQPLQFYVHITHLTIRTIMNTYDITSPCSRSNDNHSPLIKQRNLQPPSIVPPSSSCSRSQNYPSFAVHPFPRFTDDLLHLNECITKRSSASLFILSSTEANCFILTIVTGELYGHGRRRVEVQKLNIFHFSYRALARLNILSATTRSLFLTIVRPDFNQKRV